MRFEVDTDQLETSVNRMQVLYDKISRERNQMYAALEALDGLWMGEAHDTFVVQYSADNVIVTEVLEGIRDVIAKISNAKREYDTCESEVVDIISSVQV